MFPLGEQVTVLRRPPRNKVGDGEFEATHTISNVGIDWAATDESNSGNSGADDNREAVEVDVVLYCPWGSDVLSSDKVELPDGDVYRVIGKPARWRDPYTGATPGVVVRLQRNEA
jgi:hypothetical protein